MNNPPPRWPLLAGLMAAFVYGLTAARNVTFVDSGELIVACATGGIAHPPGFPLYLLFGQFFSHLPLGTVAFRLSLMSSFFGSLAVLLVALIVGELGVQVFPKTSHRVLGWCQFSTALLVGFSLTPWTWATVVEVYSLNFFLLVTCLWALLRWRRRRGGVPDLRWLILAGLAYGFSLSVHHITALLMGPAILGWLIRTVTEPRGKAWFAFVFSCLSGLLPYAYLPWRARQEPLLNWGNPQSFRAFWDHLTARQYRTHLWDSSASQWLDSTGEILGTLGSQFTLLGIGLAIWGWMVLWRRDRSLAVFFFWTSFFSIAYAINYSIAEDRSAYTLIPGLLLGLLIGTSLLTWTTAAIRFRNPIAILFFGAWVVSAVVLNYGDCDRRRDDLASKLVDDTLAGIAPGGLLLTMDWQFYSPYLYRRHLQNSRPDAVVINVNLLRRSWYLETYLRRQYPRVMEATSPSAEAYLALLKRWEAGESVNPDHLSSGLQDFLESLMSQLGRDEIHLTVPMQPGVADGFRWIPHGLTMRRITEGLESSSPPRLDIEPLMRGGFAGREPVNTKIRPFYARMLANRAHYLLGQGQRNEARSLIQQSLRLFPMARTYLLLGDLESGVGDLDAARIAYNNALLLDPHLNEAQRALRRLFPLGSGSEGR